METNNCRINLDKLSGDTARTILKSLLENDHINQELISKAIKCNPSNELCRLADNIHMMFCKKHVEEESPCEFYEEAECNLQKVEFWQQPAHALWLEKTITLMEEFQLSCEADFTRLYGKVREMQEFLQRQRSEVPNAYKMLCRLNDWKED